MENLETCYNGEVIFWAGAYGFLRKAGSTESLFFHRGDLNSEYAKVKLLDQVNFAIKQTAFGPHAGKLAATKVCFRERGRYSDYERTIGVMEQWNGVSGFLRSAQIDKSVIIHKHRLQKIKSQVCNGQYFTFSPVKSSKNPDQLFAFFAYPVDKERDIDFLRSQRENNNIPFISELISKAIWNKADKPLKVRFELVLEDIVSNEKYAIESVKRLIKRYKKVFSPGLNLLKKHLPDEYLIQLWESQIIKDHELETATRYFHHSSADTKRVIISLFNKNDQSKVLRFHLNMLLEEGRFKGQNNHIKCFLDIIHRNEATRIPEIYEEVKEYIDENFSERDQVELWLKDYIDILPDRVLENHFDLLDIMGPGVNSDKKGLILDLLKKYVLAFVPDQDLRDHRAKFTKHILFIRKHFPDQFDEVLEKAMISFSPDQQLILWKAEPSISFGGPGKFDRFASELPINLLLRFLINKDSNPGSDLVAAVADKINTENLQVFVREFDWNANYESEDPVSFLENIESFNLKFDRNVTIEPIGELIYDRIEFYSVFHLKLWLRRFVDKKRFDYVGFREKFKELSPEDQKRFKERGDQLRLTPVVEGELLRVESCRNIIEANPDFTTYLACARNIGFLDGKIQLRKENGKYTHTFAQKPSRASFNRIGPNNPLNELKFHIKVDKNNMITEVHDLENLYSQLRTAEIISALGRSTGDQTNNAEHNSYVEDFELRRNIIDYLNECQFDDSPRLLKEPKSGYATIKEKHGVVLTEYEIAHLFSIKTADGFGIIWENIDLSLDRATYIFKTTNENYSTQLAKLTDIIVSSWHLRSTLSSLKPDDKLQVFKNDLGYISNIRKERGSTGAFENWKGKLGKALWEPIPELPSQSELESLSGWTAEMPVRNGTKIDLSNIPIMNPDTGESGDSRPSRSENFPERQNAKKFEMLKILRNMNLMLEIN